MQGANSYLGLLRWRQRRKHSRVMKGRETVGETVGEMVGETVGESRRREGTAACGLRLSVLGESSLCPVRTETCMLRLEIGAETVSAGLKGTATVLQGQQGWASCSTVRSRVR